MVAEVRAEFGADGLAAEGRDSKVKERKMQSNGDGSDLES